MEGTRTSSSGWNITRPVASISLKTKSLISYKITFLKNPPKDENVNKHKSNKF